MNDIDNLIPTDDEVATHLQEDSVDNSVNPEDGLEALANELLASEGIIPSDEQPDSEAHDDLVEPEVSEEEETDPSEDAGDDEVEEEAGDDESDEPTDDETFLVDYDEVKNAVLPIKIKGEVKEMSFSEIQNQLARAESASEKSREAQQQLDELTERQSQLDEAEKWLAERMKAEQTVDELAVRASHIQQIDNALETARKDNNILEVSRLKDLRDQHQAAYDQAQEQVQSVRNELDQKHLEEQFKILENKGMNHILEEGDARTKFIEYANSNLSEAAHKAVTMDASLAIVLDKALKWDESQKRGKATKKLSGSKKSLKASAAGSISKQQSAEKQEAQKRMAQGQGTQDEAEDAILAFAKDALGV